MRRKNRRLIEEVQIELPVDKWIDKSTKIFAIGSCFAIGLRRWLKARGFNVLPIEEELAWYNTFSLRNEFHLALRGRTTKDEHYTGAKWLDPFRFPCVADTQDGLLEKQRHIDSQVIHGVQQAELIVITLGLVECHNWNGRVLCTAPSRNHGIKAKFFIADYIENLANCNQMLRYLREANPAARVILTVSPVPLRYTFAGHDHEIANTESKAILRAVAGHVERLHDFVTYFPSFELASLVDRKSRYIRDGRHISPVVVESILSLFETTYVREDV